MATWLKLQVDSVFLLFCFPAELTAVKVSRPKPSQHERMWPCCWAATKKLIDVLPLSWSEGKQLGSNPDHTLLAFSFVEGSSLGTKISWREFSKKNLGLSDAGWHQVSDLALVLRDEDSQNGNRQGWQIHHTGEIKSPWSSLLLEFSKNYGHQEIQWGSR